MCGEARCKSPQTGYAGLQQKEFGSATLGIVTSAILHGSAADHSYQLGYTQTVKAAVREKRRLSDVEKPQEGDE